MAIELLDEAVAQADAIGAPFEAVAARRHLAQALVAADDRINEVDALRVAATATATQHGFAGELGELALVCHS